MVRACWPAGDLNYILSAEVKAMPETIALKHKPSIGPWSRNMRLSLHLTQQDLADIAGVSPGDVDLFEHGLPLRLDARRRLLRELWAARAQCQLFPCLGNHIH